MVFPMTLRMRAPGARRASRGLSIRPVVQWVPTMGMPPTTMPGMPPPCSVFIICTQLPRESTTASSQLPLGCVAWLFLPRAGHTEKTVILALEPSGRNLSWHEGELYQALAVRGHAVCVADVRGTGDLSPEFGRGAAGYTRSHQSE